MRGKGKGKIKLLLALFLFICLMIGCGKEVDVEDTACNVPERQTIAENASDIQINTSDECPEGYVYDYQVSMEPIPEEIAALGGPCHGTIHAFPSKIGMALTELEMEKDPVLKAEVEKRIPEIIAALEEEIGGEFVVDGVIVEDALSWVFFCTEVETGYQFDLYYANQEYFAQMNNRKSIDNAISVADYYREKESALLREDLTPIIEEIYGEGDYTIRSLLSVDTIDVVIALYPDAVDKCIEQKKILELWRELQGYNDDLYYNLSVVFYPVEYKDVIEKQYNTVYRYDFSRTFSQKIMSYLADKGEILTCVKYSGRSCESDERNLDVLLQEYNAGQYSENTIWDYWIQ